MTSFDRFCRALALPMVLVVLLVSLPPQVAQAGLVTTDQMLMEAETGELDGGPGPQVRESQESLAQDRARVLEFLAREDVQRQIVAFGVDPAEAAERVQGLSDQEIAQIVDQIDKEPAGQGVIAFLVGAILAIVLVLLLTDLFGVTDVFPFIDPIRAK